MNGIATRLSHAEYWEVKLCAKEERNSCSAQVVGE